MTEKSCIKQCKLFIKQQGAGNGKTYGIVQMLEDDDKSHYQNFIYITKQHSAKHIIKTEFENQHKTFKSLSNIEIQQSPDQKKYIIKYFNEKSNINCQIIISTIDSFFKINTASFRTMILQKEFYFLSVMILRKFCKG